MTINHHRINQFNQLALNKEEYLFLRNKYDLIFEIDFLGRLSDYAQELDND